MNLESSINEEVIPWIKSIVDYENLKWIEPTIKIYSNDSYRLEFKNKDKVLRLTFNLNEFEYVKVWDGGFNIEDGFEIGLIRNRSNDIITALKWIFQ